MKIYLEQSLSLNNILQIRDDFWDHYLSTVRRVSEGDSLEVVGDEKVGSGTVVSTDPLSIEIKSSRTADQPHYSLILCQAISRKSSFDDIVRNVSDLGVTEIVPVLSERTVRRPNQPEKMHDRWRRIVLDSSRVSDRDWVARIHPIMVWEEALQFSRSRGRIYWGDTAGRSPRDRFDSQSQEAVLYVGPEGGFNSSEKQSLDSLGQSVSLGEENFRAGTAAMMLSTLWLDHQGWI